MPRFLIEREIPSAAGPTADGLSSSGSTHAWAAAERRGVLTYDSQLGVGPETRTPTGT
jgi:hypothetical protein